MKRKKYDDFELDPRMVAHIREQAKAFAARSDMFMAAILNGWARAGEITYRDCYGDGKACMPGVSDMAYEKIRSAHEIAKMAATYNLNAFEQYLTDAEISNACESLDHHQCNGDSYGGFKACICECHFTKTQENDI